MAERPSTPPPQAATPNHGFATREPLTPEQVKNIVGMALPSVLRFSLTATAGNQPPESQSIPRST